MKRNDIHTATMAMPTSRRRDHKTGLKQLHA
jgi:hypothetical protein